MEVDARRATESPASGSRPATRSGTSRRGGPPGDLAIYAHVYDAILDHRLPPGTKLTEDALGDIFGVSRTVVRKALFRLAHEKIVRIRPNRGATVARPTVAEARDVFESRRVVEGAVLRALVRRITADELESLRAMVAAEQAAFESGDRRNWIRRSGAFHLRLAELAGNAVLADFLKELVSRTSLIIALYETPGNSACASDEHLKLIEAIARHDGAAAAALMDAHLRACEDKLNLEGADLAVDLADVFAGIARGRG